MFRPLCLHRFTLSLLVVALAPLLRAQSETPAEPEMQWLPHNSDRSHVVP